MATPRINHAQREQLVLADLEASFPNFTGQIRSWSKVPDGQDPPDFISRDSNTTIGLELREWLDGDQMGPAKTREFQRAHVQRLLSHGWEHEYQPQNFRAAFPSLLGNERVQLADERPLRQEFFACAKEVDCRWVADSDHFGDSYYLTLFPGYPSLRKYFGSIRYIGGKPHGSLWIGEDGDGGAFEPGMPIKTLKQALDAKLNDYFTPEKQAHLKNHGLLEFDLLVHGGFNIYAYNTPSGNLSWEEIARTGAEYYATHEKRHAFNRVWFYHSLDPANEINQLLGFAPGEGGVRQLAQLWPEFRIFHVAGAR